MESPGPISAEARIASNPGACAGGSHQGVTQHILVSGEDVYVAGFVVINGINVAMLWKNGQGTALSDGSHNAKANGIAVSEQGIHVAGVAYNGQFDVAMVWTVPS